MYPIDGDKFIANQSLNNPISAFLEDKDMIIQDIALEFNSKIKINQNACLRF
ncbi:MAG: hypothetical protein ACTSX4_04525 [Candidatus Helarchaeota archaeon]